MYQLPQRPPDGNPKSWKILDFADLRPHFALRAVQGRAKLLTHGQMVRAVEARGGGGGLERGYHPKDF